MPTSEFLTTQEVADALGLTRQAVLERVRLGKLVPVYKSPAATGGYLYSPESVELASPRYTS